MSKLEPSKVFPTIVFILFVLLVGVGAYFSGAPAAPEMPGVKVIATPVIQAPAAAAEAVKNEPETPPSNDESSEPGKADAPADTSAGSSQEVAPSSPNSESNSWQ